MQRRHAEEPLRGVGLPDPRAWAQAWARRPRGQGLGQADHLHSRSDREDVPPPASGGAREERCEGQPGADPPDSARAAPADPRQVVKIDIEAIKGKLKETL